MNALEYAFYRHARNRMTPEERTTAKDLAAKADAGDKGAEWALRTLVESALWDESRTENEG